MEFPTRFDRPRASPRQNYPVNGRNDAEKDGVDRRKGGVSSVVTAWCRIVKVVQLSRAGVLLPALSLYTISGINTTEYHYHLRRLGQYIPLTKTTWTSKVSGLPSRFAWWNVLSCSGDGGCCIEGHMRYIPAPSSAAVATPGHVARLLSTDGDQLGRLSTPTDALVIFCAASINSALAHPRYPEMRSVHGSDLASALPNTG